jgi:Glycosyl transferase family 90
MALKRKGNEISIRLNGQMSVHEQLLAHRHYQSFSKLKSSRSSSCKSICPGKLQFVCGVAVFLLGGFFMVVYSSINMITVYGIQSGEEEISRERRRKNPSQNWLQSRLERFPTVAERVELYMGEWFHPPCDDKEDTFRYTKLFNGNYTTIQVQTLDRFYQFHGVIRRHLGLYLESSMISVCTSGMFAIAWKELTWQRPRPDLISDKRNHRLVCADLEDFVRKVKPALVTLGDWDPIPPVPLLSPNRKHDDFSKNMMVVSGDTDSIACRRQSKITQLEEYSPILWRFYSRRQIEIMIRAHHLDTSWDQKISQGVWRDSESNRIQSQQECQADYTCRCVKRYAQSKLVNVAYANERLGISSRPQYRLNDTVKTLGVLGLRGMQSYKVLIDFPDDHHDASIRLAWKLHSSSVLIMPPPIRITWLMENLLKPWEHYIPMNETNVEQMVQWVLDHEEEARQISERASLFMYDLFLHPNALIDEENIKSEIMKRYQSHWA